MKTLAALLILAAAMMGAAQTPCKDTEYLSAKGVCQSLSRPLPSLRDVYPGAVPGWRGGYPEAEWKLLDRYDPDSAEQPSMIVTGPQASIVFPADGPVAVHMETAGRETTLDVYRDGHVVASDPSKIDDLSKQFWQLMKDYLPVVCYAGPQLLSAQVKP